MYQKRQKLLRWKTTGNAEAWPGFFSGGLSGHLKAIMRPPQGVPGAKAPRTVAKFHFFKRCKVLENESSFQKYKHFSCPKNLFFLRKNSKNCTFDWNLWIFSNNYLKIFKFYESYKCRENFGEFSYLVEKCTVAAQGIFSVGTLGPLKDYQAPPPRRGSGGKGPPDGSEVSFFKTIQSIWKWIHFSKMSTFFFPKRSIFSKKYLGKLNIFYKNFWIFSE